MYVYTVPALRRELTQALKPPKFNIFSLYENLNRYKLKTCRRIYIPPLTDPKRALNEVGDA